MRLKNKIEGLWYANTKVNTSKFPFERAKESSYGPPYMADKINHSVLQSGSATCVEFFEPDSFPTEQNEGRKERVEKNCILWRSQQSS